MNYRHPMLKTRRPDRSGKRKIYAFCYYGGKISHLDWLLPLLPTCHHYCEPFGGSAAVLLNRKPSPIETYNDIDGELCNFFRVLRENHDELVRQLEYTPYSRNEFALACRLNDDISDIERARRFFVLITQSIHSKTNNTTIGQWGYAVLTKSEFNSRTKKYRNRIRNLNAVCERLQYVQIENIPAIECILKYDTPQTLFYCDPPYVAETRNSPNVYKCEMSNAQYEELAVVLNAACGRIAISNYNCELMDRLFPSPKWWKIVGYEKVLSSANNKRKATEVLWVNYDPYETTSSLFR